MNKILYGNFFKNLFTKNIKQLERVENTENCSFLNKFFSSQTIISFYFIIRKICELIYLL